MSAVRRRRPRGLTNPRLGALLLLVAVVGVYLGFTKDLPFLNEPYEVKANFAGAATSINKGSPVRIAGVAVGKVSDVQRGPGGTAVVTLALQDSARPLNTATTLKIRPRLFLEGNFFVDVHPGPSGAPELKDGQTIPLSQTALAVQSDEVLSALDADTRSSLQTVLKEFGGALDQGGAQAINSGFQYWRGAFANTATTMRALRGTETHDLSGFIADQAKVSQALASRDRDLAQGVTEFAQTMSTLAGSSADLQATVRSAAATLSTARPGLQQLSAALPSVDRFADDLDPALDVAPRALDRTTPLLADLRQLVSSPRLPALLTPLRPTLDDLSALVPSATALLDQLKPVTDCVTSNVLPVANAKLQDGKFTTGDPAWQELIRILPGLSGASGNFDADGWAIRYQAGGGENLVTTKTPAGDLLSLTEEPVVGARPRYTQGRQPPFVPTAKCADQQVGEIQASAMPASAAVSQRKADLPAAAPALKLVQGALATLERKAGR